jgi:Glyoxalase-like domain
VRAAIGGAHPGRGTHNALLSLGPLHYLEIIAPDLTQAESASAPVAMLKQLATPTLVDWAVHTPDIVQLAERWRKAGVAFQGPTPGSRMRPDGKMLRWQTLILKDDRDGLLPFVIEWDPGAVHPSMLLPVAGWVALRC